MSEKGEGIKKYKLVVTNSHGDVKHSVTCVVNNIALIMYDARCVLDLSGSLHKLHKFQTTILST